MGGAERLEDVLLAGLTPEQQSAVKSDKDRLLVVAGAGSGKTEVMARRIAWWIAVDGTPKDSIVAFTFTEKAAEEMQFRIRQHVERITPEGADPTLGGMYVGTIHGFCIKLLRELDPDGYHNYDVIDEAARLALVQRGFYGVLGLGGLKEALGTGQYATADTFLEAYDLLNEYDELEVELSGQPMPYGIRGETDWCKEARLINQVGSGDEAKAFAASAARYYAYLRCRRFLDFSTSQSELLRLLRRSPGLLTALPQPITHVVVDEVQDINPVQDRVIRTLLGEGGRLTAVGDHRQAIFAWRGGRVDIMATLFEELEADPDGEVVELTLNFRSTGRVIELANRWAATIDPVRSMTSSDMREGNFRRRDHEPTHVAALTFDDHASEAEWIAETVRRLVPGTGEGAIQDTPDGDRGIGYSDVVILLRSSTDARTYMTALERRGIPTIFRAGPDLFSQPEVLLMVAALARAAGLEEFVGADWNAKSLPARVADTLGCDPTPEAVIRAACPALRRLGLSMADGVEERLLLATDLLCSRIEGEGPPPSRTSRCLSNSTLIEVVRRGGSTRRVFPQRLFHLLMAEAGVAAWDGSSDRGETALFHLGALSSLVAGIETPGWTSARDFKYQMIALCLWGTQNARTEEAPLLVEPDAVTISTVHAAKGLEFAAVFLADVRFARFPSNFAKRQKRLPFDGEILKTIDPAALADNDNYDNERRLMYVALTRAERYLFVSRSGDRNSRFFGKVSEFIDEVGGVRDADSDEIRGALTLRPTERRRDFRLVSSFSDLRYYLECPHDFYLRKALGFAPTIDQAFGYGRGVHNFMRAVHADPAGWAAVADDPDALERKLQGLAQRGLFYLRYTTGPPEERMREKALRIVGDYVKSYAGELRELTFEPEREFETLLEEEQVLVSGAIDIVRRDDPPRVTLIDFKSGQPESDTTNKLTREEMELQVALYGVAAKRELQYEPERGLVRYLDVAPDEDRELDVPLDEGSLTAARERVVAIAGAIRRREFHHGPRVGPRNDELGRRCGECDFLEFCGMPEAWDYRARR